MDYSLLELAFFQQNLDTITTRHRWQLITYDNKTIGGVRDNKWYQRDDERR